MSWFGTNCETDNECVELFIEQYPQYTKSAFNQVGCSEQGTCGCNVVYSWGGGEQCNELSPKSKQEAVVAGVITIVVLIFVFIRGLLLYRSYAVRILRISDARGATMKWAVLANFVLAVVHRICRVSSLFLGPVKGYEIATASRITNQLFLAVGLMALLILTLALISISTSMKQITSFGKARYPIIALILVFYSSQIVLLFLDLGSYAIYITVVMISLFAILTIIGPGWMFVRLMSSVQLTKDRDLDLTKRLSICESVHLFFKTLIVSQLWNDGSSSVPEENVGARIRAQSKEANTKEAHSKESSKDSAHSKETDIVIPTPVQQAPATSSSRVVSQKFSRAKNANAAGSSAQKSSNGLVQFLARVLLLSIRISSLLIGFIVVTILGLEEDQSLSIGVGRRFLLAELAFIFAFLSIDSIFWFFSDVLRKQIARAKGSSSSANRHPASVSKPNQQQHHQQQQQPALGSKVSSKESMVITISPQGSKGSLLGLSIPHATLHADTTVGAPGNEGETHTVVVVDDLAHVGEYVEHDGDFDDDIITTKTSS